VGFIDLELGRLGHLVGGAQDRVDLHLVDLGVEDAEPAGAGAEHRVLLGDRLGAGEQALELGQLAGVIDAGALELGGEVDEVGAETRAAAGRAGGW
jgi:hypothetical protein